MIIFLPFAFLAYHIEFQERSKTPFSIYFANIYIKYANERTDEIIHSTKLYYIKYKNRVILRAIETYW